MNHMNKNTLLVRRLTNKTHVSLKSTFVDSLESFKPKVNAVAQKISLGRHTEMSRELNNYPPPPGYRLVIGFANDLRKTKRNLPQFRFKLLQAWKQRQPETALGVLLLRAIQFLGGSTEARHSYEIFRGTNIGRALRILRLAHFTN